MNTLMAFDRKFEDDVIIIESGGNSFCKMVNFLYNIDQMQYCFIDANRECILFDYTLIFLVKNWDQRKSACYDLNKKYQCLYKKFINQSWAAIVREVYNIENGGDILKSSYSISDRELCDTQCIEPVHIGIEPVGKGKYKMGANCPKSYSNAIVKYFKEDTLGVVNMFENYTDDKCILNWVRRC